MNSKSKQIGIKVHNSIGNTFKAIGRNVAKGAKATYAKVLTPAGHGIKAGAVSVKDFGAGLVLGERNIAEEQKQLLDDKLTKLREGGIDPESMLYKSLEKQP
jgi:hypothetical protein